MEMMVLMMILYEYSSLKFFLKDQIKIFRNLFNHDLVYLNAKTTSIKIILKLSGLK